MPSIDLRKSLSLALVWWVALCGSTWAGVDLVLTHGHVYTADAKSRWAEAVAVTGSKLIYVGSNAGVKAKQGRNTKAIDLGGRLLLPGSRRRNPLRAAGIPLEALIDSVTIRGAEAEFIEKETGSITVGRGADLVVFDKDLFKIAP
jgi:predicted amidohydrolase YtcJ